MWIRYDNEDSWTNMRIQALAKGYTHYFWASDDCFGYDGMYNGGTFIFFSDIDAINDPYIKMDAKRYSRMLE